MIQNNLLSFITLETEERLNKLSKQTPPLLLEYNFLIYLVYLLNF